MLARATAAAAATAATRRRAASTFASAEEHLAALAAHSGLPRGFKVGSQGFAFRPRELPHKEAKMVVTLITLDAPTPDFAAMFTSNAFPGAPVLVGRRRLAERALQAVVINNKISNVCAPGGVEDSERLCGEVARLLGLPAGELVLPSSTGVIGWKLPVDDMVAALPAAAATLQGASVLPAAQGIMTTDMYPKVRSALVPGTAGGRIVGIAKGAGMIEPNLATMLVYLLTDVAVPRDALRAALPAAVHGTFNALSIDSDQSTSDTVVLLSSGAVPLGGASLADFTAALTAVCGQLSEDVVRNGEGVQHVMRVTVSGAPTEALARDVGKSIVNSPLFKCAVAGNDPNVGRLVAAIGKCIGNSPAHRGTDVSRTVITMGGTQIFGGGQFQLAPETEAALVAHLAGAQLWSAFVARGAARRGAARARLLAVVVAWAAAAGCTQREGPRQTSGRPRLRTRTRPPSSSAQGASRASATPRLSHCRPSPLVRLPRVPRPHPPLALQSPSPRWPPARPPSLVAAGLQRSTAARTCCTRRPCRTPPTSAASW